MDDLMIIELYFARDEQAIEETDTKYGKLCFHMANNFLSNDADAEECVNDIRSEEEGLVLKVYPPSVKFEIAV